VHARTSVLKRLYFVVVDEGDNISVVSTTGRVAQEKLQALSRGSASVNECPTGLIMVPMHAWCSN